MGANNYLARGDGAKGQGALSDASISVNDVAYNLTPDSTVRIISGDISRIDADALITAINSKQWWSGNIDRVIMKKAEYHFHQQASECDLQDGKAIVAWGSQDETISGSFRNVVFVVDDLKRPLYEIVRTGLEAAADAGFKKVSLPTIRMGTMLGRVEKTTEEAVQEMIKGVEEFFNANANSSLKEVTFVVFADPEIKRALISALKTAAALSIKPTNVKEDLLNEGFRSPLTDAERIAAREEKLKKAGF